MEDILEILSNIRPDIDFDNESSLVTDGKLDSLDIITLVGELNDAFDIEIATRDMIPSNFDSVTAIYDMVRRLEDE